MLFLVLGYLALKRSWLVTCQGKSPSLRIFYHLSPLLFHFLFNHLAALLLLLLFLILFSGAHLDATLPNPFNPSKALHASPHASPLSPKALFNQATVIRICTTATINGLSSVVSFVSYHVIAPSPCSPPPALANPSDQDYAHTDRPSSPRPSSTDTGRHLCLPPRRELWFSSLQMMGAGDQCSSRTQTY
jgi:hypothetical protein